jgi:hypothetical protein
MPNLLMMHNFQQYRGCIRCIAAGLNPPLDMPYRRNEARRESNPPKSQPQFTYDTTREAARAGPSQTAKGKCPWNVIIRYKSIPKLYFFDVVQKEHTHDPVRDRDRIGASKLHLLSRRKFSKGSVISPNKKYLTSSRPLINNNYGRNSKTSPRGQHHEPRRSSDSV